MANPQVSYINEIKSLSLLSATTGQLEIARVPVVDKPDWIIPRALILAVVPFSQRIWTYLWQADTTLDSETLESETTADTAFDGNETSDTKKIAKQDIPLYHLFPKSMTPSNIVILESFTDVHRLGLQIVNEVQYHQIRIADLKDADTTASQENDNQQLPTDGVHLFNTSDSTLVDDSNLDITTDTQNTHPLEDTRNLAPQAVEQSFIFQPVMFRGELCVVPDLDKLSHYLVDLDSE